MSENFEKYEYKPEVFLESIDRARVTLGIKKNELSTSLGFKPGYFSTSLSEKANMRLVNAFRFSSAVGITLNEAIRGKTDTRFQKFLNERGVRYDDLPSDCILRTYTYKAIIPSFYDAIAFSGNEDLIDLIWKCMTMDSQRLFQFFYLTIENGSPKKAFAGLEGFDRDFNALYKSQEYPNIVGLFGEHGLNHEMYRRFLQKKKPEFAKIAGLSLSQLYKYLHAFNNTEKTITEPQLGRVVDICNRLDADIDLMISPCYSIERFSNINLDVYDNQGSIRRLEVWHEHFFATFRNAFSALKLLQVIENYYWYICVYDRDEEQAKSMVELARRLSA